MVTVRWLDSMLRAASVMAIGLAGCTSLPSQAPQDPLFRLAPHTLGRSLAWQQRLEVATRGARLPALDAMLEADAVAVQLAVLGAGQTLARLRWDGTIMTADQVQGWPHAIPPEQVLSDLQLALWPLEPLRHVLPADATLDEEGPLRVLRRGGTVIATVRGAGTGHIEIVNRRRDYTLRIESVAIEAGSP